MMQVSRRIGKRGNKQVPQMHLRFRTDKLAVQLFMNGQSCREDIVVLPHVASMIENAGFPLA